MVYTDFCTNTIKYFTYHTKILNKRGLLQQKRAFDDVFERKMIFLCQKLYIIVYDFTYKLPKIEVCLYWTDYDQQSGRVFFSKLQNTKQEKFHLKNQISRAVDR